RRRRAGVTPNTSTWPRSGRGDGPPAETDEMIHRAHASRWHWARAAGTKPVNLARGEWLCSRVYSTIGRAEPARWHAQRCVEINEAIGGGGGPRGGEHAGRPRGGGPAARVPRRTPP